MNHSDPKPSSQASLPLGRIVRFHRKRAGLTQVGLARLAGVGKTLIFDIEKGKATVRLDGVLRVLATLNVRLDWRSPLREAFMEEETHAPGADPAAR